MKPYSQDIRERIIMTLEANEESQVEIADRFGVSLSFVEKIGRRWRQTGSCAAMPHAGGRQRDLKDHEKLIRKAIAKQPDLTLNELCERVAAASRAEVSVKTMCLELQRLKLVGKKSRSTPANATHLA